MEIPKTILITGGSGMVGSAISEIQNNYNYKFIFLSSKDGDLSNYSSAFTIFKLFKPNFVIHLAANVGGLYKNLNNNMQMFESNIKINMNVLKCSFVFKVEKCISILSTCIFPDEIEYPINETKLHLGDPHNSNIGYSYAKRMLEVQSRIYREEHGCDFSCIIPSNIYGKYDNFNLETSHVIPGLIHQCYLSKINHHPFSVRGTGKPLRQFLYSNDFAVLIMNILESTQKIDNIIISPNEEISIGELAKMIHIKMNNPNDLIFDSEYSDGQYRKTADNSKLKQLFPNFNFTKLEYGLNGTIIWFMDNHFRCRK